MIIRDDRGPEIDISSSAERPHNGVETATSATVSKFPRNFTLTDCECPTKHAPQIWRREGLISLRYSESVNAIWTRQSFLPSAYNSHPLPSNLLCETLVIRDFDMSIQRPRAAVRYSLQALPAWLISVCVHTAICACLVFGFDHATHPSGDGIGGDGRPLQLITTFSSEGSTGRPGTELEDSSEDQAFALSVERESVVEIPTAPKQTEATEATVEAAQPIQPPDEPVEGLAVPDPVASSHDRRLIKRKYSQLLQNEVASTRSLTEIPEGTVTGTGTATAQGGRGTGTSAGTSFFEINATGNLFCYVVDSSSSMDEQDSIGAARNELIASLEQLKATQRFQILFYDAELHPMTNGRQQTFMATDANVRFARQFIFSQQTGGGTVHKPALQAALKLNPDVIFFLTDGETPELSYRDLWDLKQANRKRVQIHVIEFGTGAKLGSLNWLEQLSRDHRGSYRYLDVSR